MASMGGGYLDPEPLIRTIRDGGLLNRTLQGICQAEGQSKNGVKSDLQARIVERIRLYASINDVVRFERLKTTIYSPATVSSNSSPYRGMAGSSSSPARGTPTIATPATYLNHSGSHTNGYNMGGGTNAYRGYGQQRGLQFKPSPFFKLEQQLGETTICDTMQHHRHTVKISLKVQDHPILFKVPKDPALRVMVFCAGDEKDPQDIAFPHQSEIKVNGGEIKANLRGLKNKPGSTRPVDITKDLRLNLPAYGNSVEMTYALTTKAGGASPQKFFLVIYVVRLVPVTDLVEALKNGKRITQKAVLDDMRSKAKDADIVTTASVLSLKCPLSTLRIDLPCRSIACRHNQCFDATSYLQLQEQGPTWLCPICNNSASFDSLAVDEYVRNILKSTSKSVDQVTIQPDGKWELHGKNEPQSQSNGFASDDDDLVEVTKTGDSVSMGTPLTQRTPTGAPPQRSASSRDPSSTSAKRPITAVIDLTSSGDEDEEPVARVPKRQQTNSNNLRAPFTIPAYRPAPPPSNANAYPQPRS